MSTLCNSKRGGEGEEGVVGDVQFSQRRPAKLFSRPRSTSWYVISRWGGGCWKEETAPLPVYFLRQSLEGEPGNKRCTVHSLNGALWNPKPWLIIFLASFPPPSNHPLPSTLVRHISPILKASPLAYASRSPRWLAAYLSPSIIHLPPYRSRSPPVLVLRIHVATFHATILGLLISAPSFCRDTFFPPGYETGGIRRGIDWEASDSGELNGKRVVICGKFLRGNFYEYDFDRWESFNVVWILFRNQRGRGSIPMVQNCEEEIIKEIIYFLIINLIYQSWIPSKSFVSNCRIL